MYLIFDVHVVHVPFSLGLKESPFADEVKTAILTSVVGIKLIETATKGIQYWIENIVVKLEKKNGIRLRSNKESRREKLDNR